MKTESSLVYVCISKMSRDTQFRIQNSHIDVGSLFEPFSWVNNQFDLDNYSIKNIQHPIVSENQMYDAGNFPDNIEKYYWVYPGKNDEKPWYALMRLTNGNYALYKATCDYTGFDCQGYMELFVSPCYESIILYAMTDRVYAKYIKKTKPFV